MQHKLLGEMCFAELQTKGKNAREKEDEESSDDEDKEVKTNFGSFFDFIGIYGGTIDEATFTETREEQSANGSNKIDSIDFSKWLKNHGEFICKPYKEESNRILAMRDEEEK